MTTSDELIREFEVEVENCPHRFTRVIEDGGDYCAACGITRNVDGTVRPSIKPLETDVGDITLRARFTRNEYGTRLLTLSAPMVLGRWAAKVFPLADVWQPGVVASLSLKGVWDARFGEFWAGYGDDTLLVRDAILAARYLNLPADERMDFASPSTGDLEKAADTLGLRLPRMAAKPGHALSYGRFATLAEYIAALAKPKAAGPVNLRASSDRLPDNASESADGRLLSP